MGEVMVSLSGSTDFWWKQIKKRKERQVWWSSFIKMLQVNIFFYVRLCAGVCVQHWIFFLGGSIRKKMKGGGGDEGKYTGVTCTWWFDSGPFRSESAWVAKEKVINDIFITASTYSCNFRSHACVALFVFFLTYIFRIKSRVRVGVCLPSASQTLAAYLCPPMVSQPRLFQPLLALTSWYL